MKLASLAIEIGSGTEDGVTPTEAHVLPRGSFRATDGRPVECEAWILDDAAAKSLMKLFAARANDTLIDYEHQSLNAENNGQPVPAAGWFHELDWREAGLFAVNVAWTAKAQQFIASREYRYISAVFFYDPKTGIVVDLVSVALTNTPALDGLESLDVGALSKKFNVGEVMAGETEVAALASQVKERDLTIAGLTAEKASLSTQVTALTTQVAALQSLVDGFGTQQKAAALAVEFQKKDELVTAALKDGRIAPALKGWAEKLDLAALTEFLDTAKPLGMLNKQNNGRDDKGGGLLSDVELAMCSRMGVSEENYLKAKAQLDKQTIKAA